MADDQDKTLDQNLSSETSEPDAESQKSDVSVANSETNEPPASSPQTPAPSLPTDTLATDGNQDVPPNARWYVVHTYSGHENKVAAAIKQRIEAMKITGRVFDILVPTRDTVTVKRGKKEEVKEKIFPGYILVRMILDDDSWLVVRTTPGVTAFVGVGNRPTPLSEKEVQAIMKFSALAAPKFKAAFSKGEAVKIIDGPFADFLGTVESIDEGKGKVRVLVSIFGRETPVELDFLQVSKL